MVVVGMALLQGHCVIRQQILRAGFGVLAHEACGQEKGVAAVLSRGKRPGRGPSGSVLSCPTVSESKEPRAHPPCPPMTLEPLRAHPGVSLPVRADWKSF